MEKELPTLDGRRLVVAMMMLFVYRSVHVERNTVALVHSQQQKKQKAVDSDTRMLPPRPFPNLVVPSQSYLSLPREQWPVNL